MKNNKENMVTMIDLEYKYRARVREYINSFLATASNDLKLEFYNEYMQMTADEEIKTAVLKEQMIDSDDILKQELALLHFFSNSYSELTNRYMAKLNANENEISDSGSLSHNVIS